MAAAVQSKRISKPETKEVIGSWAIDKFCGPTSGFGPSGLFNGSDDEGNGFDYAAVCEIALNRVKEGAVVILGHARQFAKGEIPEIAYWRGKPVPYVWGLFEGHVQSQIDTYFRFKMAGSSVS